MKHDPLFDNVSISFKKIIARGLELHVPEHEWDNSRIHVTDLAVFLEEDDAKCGRALQLRLRGAEQKKQHLGQILMFDHGHRIHERLHELFVKGLPDNMEIVGKEEQVEIDGITGRVDVIVKYTPKGGEGEKYGSHPRYIIGDWKTSRGAAFQYMTEARPSYNLQVCTYIEAYGGDWGKVVVADREGQNFIDNFDVRPDPNRVRAAIQYTKALAEAEELEPILTPKVQINTNKGPDSVKLGLRWQCSFCDFLDVSCEGGLPEEHRYQGIVGHILGPGEFKVKKGCEGAREYIDAIMDAAGANDHGFPF